MAVPAFMEQSVRTPKPSSIEDQAMMVLTNKHPCTIHQIAFALWKASPKEKRKEAVRVKVYHPECNYQEGECLWVENHYGKSMATVLKVIRQPGMTSDTALFTFEDASYIEAWEKNRRTPYYAVDSGRSGRQPSWKEIQAAQGPAAPPLDATAVVKLAERLEPLLQADDRFMETTSGWILADLPKPPARIRRESGGKAIIPPLKQGAYTPIILKVLSTIGDQASLETIKLAVIEELPLSRADWKVYGKKILWNHRLQGALKISVLVVGWFSNLD